jgi:hypothetical protein
LIAVVASVVVVLYALVPSGLFRFLISLKFPAKNQKTRTQEFTFATLFCLIPFCLALLLVWTIATWPFATREDALHRRLAYRTVFMSLSSDKAMDDSLQAGVYWNRANSVLRRQMRFLSWYYLLVAGEAGIVIWLATQYDSEGMRWNDAIVKRVSRPIISEWTRLFTNFGSPIPDVRIELDVLSTEGFLYQGKLKDYFFNSEGELAGVLLSGAARYDREQYSAHRKADLEATIALWPKTPKHFFTASRKEYWRPIPGADLFYIPRERIANINVRHVPDDASKAAEERLSRRNITGYAITKAPRQTTSATAEVSPPESA